MFCAAFILIKLCCCWLHRCSMASHVMYNAKIQIRDVIYSDIELVCNEWRSCGSTSQGLADHTHYALIPLVNGRLLCTTR